jgi:seryl-tRNA synthetase
MEITPEQIQAAVAIAGLVGSALTAIGLGVWRGAKWAGQISSGIRTVIKTVNTQSDRIKSLEEKVVELAVVQRERGDSTAKLEGKVELTTAALAASTKAAEKTADKVEALWRTLQTLHPDKVPKRASDRS